MRWLGWTTLATWAGASAALANDAAQQAGTGIPAIPEPGALALFVLGVSVVGVAVRTRKS
jgi:hypothetical protein